MMNIEKSINFLVQRIISEVHPLRIILFGSVTRNEFQKNSDIDLLIVMPEGTHRRHTAQRLYYEIKNVGIPFDLVVTTPGDLERHKENAGLIYKYALEEGKEVYAA
jgi:predicted nucleotidyltransferase